MGILYPYLPQDRLCALACGDRLPDRIVGSALFADISGFTPLTEVLTRALGPRRGAEELAHALNHVYDVLIALVQNYGGSVISFAGDAMTCWFGEPEQAVLPQPVRSGVRAAACALAMQAEMQGLAQERVPSGETISLTMKTAVASGPARRFVVGDDTVQLLDVLAGATLDRMAAAERLANKGEVVVDEATVAQAKGTVQVREWRTDPAGERFALLDGLRVGVEPGAPVQDVTDALSDEQLKCWLLPAVYERLQAGAGEFLTELRPAVALFIKFTGIDYDGDVAAGQRLDAYIRWVQQVLARYEGVLLGITMGDKGSHVYAVLGALAAHEDDPRRAASAALELQAPPAGLCFIQSVQIGLSQGVMRVGAYGGHSRRTYSALGDSVNLAARLMQAAAPGQVVVSASVHQTIKNAFVCQPLPPLRVKGKSEPVAAWALLGVGQHSEVDLHEPAYRLPMVGREQELGCVAARLDQALQGHGQIVGITAEAGMGKSRLVAEIVRLAAKAGPSTASRLAICAGACQSYGTNVPYLVWRDIWRSLFHLDLAAPVVEQIRRVEQVLAQIDPRFVQRAPLLNLVLDLPFPENDLTRSLDAKLRKESLETLLVDCLKALATRAPLLLILEDLHWLDPLSHSLLEAIGRTIADLPVLMVLAYRPPELARLQVDRVMSLPHATTIRLSELTPLEAEQWVRLKLVQLGVLYDAALVETVQQKILDRTQGNPFFIEEILNYLQDRALDWRDPQAFTQLDWPDSLHTLILSRMDQLAEHEKMTLKVASIVGRVFRVDWLHGYYPDLGSLERIKADLSQLSRLDITPLDTPEPELAYLFKHIVTQEVAYESMPYVTRAQLHEQLARWLEGEQSQSPSLDLLAFHYGRSENLEKKRELFKKAGDSARIAYANESALDYYAQLLPLLADPVEQGETQMMVGTVLQQMGRWQEADCRYREALALAESTGQTRQTISARQALGVLFQRRGDYAVALELLGQAKTGWEMLGDRAGVGQTLAEIGIIFWRQGKPDESQRQLEASLAIKEELNDTQGVAAVLRSLGNVASRRGDYAGGQRLYEQSLALFREMDDRLGISLVLSNLGLVASNQGDYATARSLYEESLALAQEIGDPWSTNATLNNLGDVAGQQGDHLTARACYEKSLVWWQNMGDKIGIIMSYFNLGSVAVDLKEYVVALAHFSQSLRLAYELGDKRFLSYSLARLAGMALLTDSATAGHATQSALRCTRLAAAAETLRSEINLTWDLSERQAYAGAVAAARAALGEDEFGAAWEQGRRMTMEETVAYAELSAL